jgi:recombinational DNA repair protein RecT
MASSQLMACDKFSLYACFATAAVNGYSFDPQDQEIYLIPMGGKAVLWRQAGAHVKRLKRTGQIISVEQAKIVYQGDHFEVENGRVVSHKEKFETETMVAGYVKFILDESGRDIFFIYRKSDWEAWKKKSQQQTGDNWSGNNGQPGAAFLRTKIVLHACKEKIWATGQTPISVETYSVEVDEVTTDKLPEPSVKNLGEPVMMVTSSEPTYETKAAQIAMTSEHRKNGTVTVDSSEGF